jgi:putative CocE/NonD family hydrolase
MTMRYEMQLDKDVAVPMRDGASLRANVFRPVVPADAPAGSSTRFPVIMTLGPYGKDVHLSQFMPEAWEALQRRHPEILAASSCRHLVFETPDPECWAPHGYVVVKVDSRGAGKSPGRLDVNSPAEFRDFFDAIEWAATQPWSNGKVGLLGISYYAAGQWSIAAQRPPSLAAIIPWQGTFDFYRDRTRQGGILASGFLQRWWNRSVLRNQHGNVDTPLTDLLTGERNTGPAALSPAELAANRADYIGDLRAHPLEDDWYRSRTPDLSRIEVPALVVANWGGLGLHLRGTLQGWRDIASRDKWLKVQPGSYFLTFLHPDSVALQRRFFDRYLKGIDNGWEAEPRVEVQVRSMDDGVAQVVRDTDWPLPRTEWRRWYLDASAAARFDDAGHAADEGRGGLATQVPAAALTDCEPASRGLSFSTGPLSEALTLAGPIRARLWVASASSDTDLFLTVRAFDAQGREATFFSATEPKSPVSQGWLRVSHRRLDPVRSTEAQPWQAHDRVEPLVPGEVVAVDVEVWPGSIALPAGGRLDLIVAGRDFERPEEPGPFKGSGFFYHDDPLDRPPEIFGARFTVHTGGERASFLQLPVLP